MSFAKLRQRPLNDAPVSDQRTDPRRFPLRATPRYNDGNLLQRLARFDNRTFTGKLLRFPLALIPRGLVVPIVSGTLRGSRWIVGAHTHGCWLGTYEPSTQAAVRRFTRRGDVFYDLGANAGFYTLLAAKLGARVVAVEPLPRNVDYLRRHLRLNHCRNVEIVETVVLDRPGSARLMEASSATAHVAEEGVPVKATTLDEMVYLDGYPIPSVIKCDVEGAEARVLAGGRRVLMTYRPVLLLSVHSEPLRVRCVEQLTEWGYRVETDPSNVYELVAMGS